MYDFELLEKQKNFRYSEKDKYNRKTQSIYYTSYTSAAKDLNNCTYEKLMKHKELIDFSIKYVSKQIEQGFRAPCIIYPVELNKSYRYSVYQYALQQKKLKDRKAKENHVDHSTQKYWVYGKNIKTYAFRRKNKKSKFQSFIEFYPSYSQKETIKLNLRMSNRGYAQRDTIYTEGFDLVFEKDNVNVRHVSEEIVNKVKKNNIEKFICIDCYSNIHVAVLNTDKTLANEYGIAKLNTNKKVVCCKYYQERNTKTVRRLFDSMKNWVEPERFAVISETLKRCIKAKLRNCLGSDNESKVTILLNYSDCTRTQVFNYWFRNITRDLCNRSGLKLEIIGTHEEIVKDWLKSFKKNDIEYRKRLNLTLRYSEENIDKPKTYESLLYLMTRKYQNYYPVLIKNRKFSDSVSTGTDENPNQVLAKPKYPTVEEFKKQYAEWHKTLPEEFPIDEKQERQWFVSTVKDIAEDYYKDLLRSQNAYPGHQYCIEDQMDIFV